MKPEAAQARAAQFGLKACTVAELLRDPGPFLGGSHQTCRKLVDAGEIGQPLAGSAFFMCPGHERWHPNPAFYYAAGGGPMLDMGPYYITALVNLIGPVARVSGATSRV